MSYRISILDKSPLAAGETAAQALTRTLTLAQQAEAWGYHRFWVAEHHNTDQLASPSPELVIAWLLGHTRRIRLGSGGVMLQHYSPYKVAENFNLLASIAPGRVDLGVGKAPGGLPLATRALQQGIDPAQKGTFADSLAQLDNWLSLTDAAGEENLRATPIPPRRADGFLLGASLESVQLAARLDAARARMRVYYHLEPAAEAYLMEQKEEYRRTAVGVQNVLKSCEVQHEKEA